MAVVADVAALNLLARRGIAVIWELHVEAAAAHREQRDGAESLIEIADAAEEWLRRLHEQIAPESP
jgi:hypothetical protein